MEHRDTESQSFIAEGEIVRELFRHYHSVIPSAVEGSQDTFL